MIQRLGNKPLPGAEKPNIISVANRVITTSRKSYMFQTCNVNYKERITIKNREKKAVVDMPKNSNDLIREIQKIYRKITSI